MAWGDNYRAMQCSIAQYGICGDCGGRSITVLGLKADGSIVAWGYNDYGQCNVPSPNTGFVAIAAGYDIVWD